MLCEFFLYVWGKHIRVSQERCPRVMYIASHRSSFTNVRLPRPKNVLTERPVKHITYAYKYPTGCRCCRCMLPPPPVRRNVRISTAYVCNLSLLRTNILRPCRRISCNFKFVCFVGMTDALHMSVGKVTQPYRIYIQL